MTKKYLPWLILGLILWFLFSFLFCKKCFFGETNTAAASPAVVKETVQKPVENLTNGWAINDGANFKTSSADRFNFNGSNLNHIKPVSAALKNSMTATVNYLKKNPKRSLTLTGLYGKSESYNGVLSSLGMARANDVKAYLISLGASASQLNLADRLVPDNKLVNNKLMGGVDFSFAGANNNAANRIADIKARLINKPPAVVVRFNTGQSSINLSPQQQKDFTDIIYYLDNVSTSKLEIGGHTDNVGAALANVNLSKDRATFVQNYLARNGIANTRMSSQGYGPKRPLNNNANAQEKALNRRVEVVLKNN